MNRQLLFIALINNNRDQWKYSEEAQLDELFNVPFANDAM